MEAEVVDTIRLDVDDVGRLHIFVGIEGGILYYLRGHGLGCSLGAIVHGKLLVVRE